MNFNFFWLIHMITSMVNFISGNEIKGMGFLIIAVIYNCVQIILEEIRK